jgi:vacuolar-type H+-ATPase subunit I/STV1
MYSFENYLDEDLLNEDLLNEDLLETYGEDFDEDFDEAKRRSRRPSFRSIRPSVRPKVAQRSNFGKALSGRSADYVTKSDLKKALDSISSDVNELKKTSITTNKALASLDAKHTELAKIDSRKNENQTKVLRNMQMMNMMSSLLVQPKLITSNLKIVEDKEGEQKIEVVPNKSAIEIDQTMSLLLPMMTTMGDSSSGKSDNSMNMMLPLLLIMKDKDSGSSSDTMMPLVLMMMMQNQK